MIARLERREKLSSDVNKTKYGAKYLDHRRFKKKNTEYKIIALPSFDVEQSD